MFHIAFGVCLGILAAVLILNWWQAHLVRREERRERKAYRKMMRAYETPPEQATNRFIGVIFCSILAFLIGLPLLGTMMH